MMNPLARIQSYDKIVGDVERFSLSPAEGERAGVRGKSCAAIDQFQVQHLHPTSHPDPLPYRRGEGSDRQDVAYGTVSSLKS